MNPLKMMLHYKASKKITETAAKQWREELFIVKDNALFLMVSDCLLDTNILGGLPSAEMFRAASAKLLDLADQKDAGVLPEEGMQVKSFPARGSEGKHND